MGSQNWAVMWFRFILGKNSDLVVLSDSEILNKEELKVINKIKYLSALPNMVGYHLTMGLLTR
jgi:hypothetical protein